MSVTDDDELGYTETVKHKTFSQYKEAKEHIQKLLKQGIICGSHSPCSSLVRKKNGSLHLCIHYRKLNTKTVKDAYLLP